MAERAATLSAGRPWRSRPRVRPVLCNQQEAVIGAVALIDRVPHRRPLANIRGNSFRMREHIALHRAL